MRIVLDTNVLVSALFFRGYPERLLDLILDSRLTAVATAEIIAEYRATVERLASRYSQRSPIAPETIFERLLVIPQTNAVHVCRDSDDDKFISCAVDGGCLYIVSGDNDLLALGNHMGVCICTVAQFLTEFYQKHSFAPH